jgi:hypothetical protein
MPQLTATIRAAALQLSAASLTRRSLQRVAIWYDVPAVLALTIAVPFITAGPALADIKYTAAATVCGALVGLSTLAIAASWRRAATHFAFTAALAVLGVAIELPSARVNPAAADAFTAFCVTPAAVYAASLPLIAVALGYAWRIIATIDPRARLVLGLLQAVHLTSRDARWLHDTRARDQVAAQIERTARGAERGLPRLLARRIQDPATSSWLRERAQLIGARIRECKRLVLLPDVAAMDSIRTELLRLLVYATSSDWGAMCAQQAPPSRTPGLLRRYAPHFIIGVIFVVAAFTLPELLPSLKAVAVSNLRTILVLSGIVSFVPLDGGGLNRIPDAFAEVVSAQ